MAADTLEDLLADPALEAALVVALAADPAAADAVRDELAPDAFTVADLAAAYDAALAGRPFAAPAGADPAPDPTAAARRLADLAGGRKLAAVPTLLGRRLSDLHAGRTPLADVLADFAAAAARGVDAATPAQPLRPAAALVADVLANIGERHRARQETGSAVLGLRTGFDKLDEWTGGLEGGTIAVLLGAPNLGKSTLANHVAYAVARDGAPVLYVSYENPGADLVRKHLLRLANLGGADVLKGNVPPEAFADAARVFAAEAGRRLYYLDAAAGTDVGAIRAAAYRVRRRHPDAPRLLIVLDYLQKAASLRAVGDGPRGAGFDDLRGSVSQLLQHLRDLARELDSPLLAISSVNRAAYATENARPTLASGKESGSVEFDADTVLLLSEDKEHDGALPPGLLAVRLELAKNRFGPKGAIPLFFSPSGARFTPREPVPTMNGRPLR